MAQVKQSAPARCPRDLGNTLTCGAQLQLCITKNPIGALPFDDLIVTRCHAGHLEDSRGVLRDAAPVDDGPLDNWGAF